MCVLRRRRPLYHPTIKKRSDTCGHAACKHTRMDPDHYACKPHLSPNRITLWRNSFIFLNIKGRKALCNVFLKNTLPAPCNLNHLTYSDPRVPLHWIHRAPHTSCSNIHWTPTCPMGGAKKSLHGDSPLSHYSILSLSISSFNKGISSLISTE